MKKIKSSPSSVEDSSSFPVCLQKASKSFTEPGSVAIIFNVCAASKPLIAFFARKIGNGQLKPLKSTI